MTELTAEERAKRALDYSLPFPGDKVERWGVPSDLEGMVEPEGMPTTRTIDAVGRIVKEIREARQEEREAIITLICEQRDSYLRTDANGQQWNTALSDAFGWFLSKVRTRGVTK